MRIFSKACNGCSSFPLSCWPLAPPKKKKSGASLRTRKRALLSSLGLPCGPEKERRGEYGLPGPKGPSAPLLVRPASRKRRLTKELSAFPQELLFFTWSSWPALAQACAGGRRPALRHNGVLRALWTALAIDVSTRARSRGWAIGPLARARKERARQGWPRRKNEKKK